MSVSSPAHDQSLMSASSVSPVHAPAIARSESIEKLYFAGERPWRQLYPWLKSNGYLLRARYAPDWVPSWKNNNKIRWQCEDNEPMRDARAPDATRISDGKFVCVKGVISHEHPLEESIATYLSSNPGSEDLENHCVPILDVLKRPGEEEDTFLIMPLLRPWDNPGFETVGEVVEFIRQMFEGLKYIHDRGVAHRDVTSKNIMMDATPLFPEPWHPVDYFHTRDWKNKFKQYSRTQRPVKYYFIDFGFSRRYESSLSNPLEPAGGGGDKTVPEHQDPNTLSNPFFTDIYCVGNIIRTKIMTVAYGFDFLQELVSDMVQEDPAKRPTISEVSERYMAIIAKLGDWKLRSRYSSKDELGVVRFFRNLLYIRHIVMYKWKKISAMPTPVYAQTDKSPTP